MLTPEPLYIRGGVQYMGIPGSIPYTVIMRFLSNPYISSGTQWL